MLDNNYRCDIVKEKGGVMTGCRHQVLRLGEKCLICETEEMERRSVFKDTELIRLETLLNPRLWTEEMHRAWHQALPDAIAAFKALRECDI